MKYISTAEADILYAESKKTIQRKLKEVAENQSHPKRDHLLPNSEDYVALKQKGKQVRFQATQELLDALEGLTRKEGTESSPQTKRIGTIRDTAEQALDVIDDTPYIRLLKQQLEHSQADNAKLLATMHEMTLNNRLENMLRAKAQGLLVPEMDKDGKLHLRTNSTTVATADATIDTAAVGASQNGAKKKRVTKRSKTPPKPSTKRRSRGVLGRFFGATR